MRRVRNNIILQNCSIGQQENVLQQPNIEKVVTSESCGLQHAISIKLLKHKKYLEILQEFLKDKYEYTPCCFLTIDDITNDYNEFIKNNDKIKNFNGLFGLVLKDIPLIDNKYCQKDIEFCNNCNNKYFKNCCEEYKSKKDRRTGCCYRKRCIMNISKK